MGFRDAAFRVRRSSSFGSEGAAFAERCHDWVSTPDICLSGGVTQCCTRFLSRGFDRLAVNRVRYALHLTWPHVHADRFPESSFGAVWEFVTRACAAPGVRLSSVNVCTFFGRRRQRLARAAADLASEAVAESSSEGSASIEGASVVELASPSGETGTAADM